MASRTLVWFQKQTADTTVRQPVDHDGRRRYLRQGRVPVGRGAHEGRAGQHALPLDVHGPLASFPNVAALATAIIAWGKAQTGYAGAVDIA